MQLGIIGLPKAGKTTLFNLLTCSDEVTDKFQQSKAANLGVARVPDSRLEALRELFKPKKFTPATVQYVDIPGIQKGEGAEDLNLAGLREVDALVHVVRTFEDPEILHTDGSVDPGRDLATLDLELILADLSLVEKRLGKLSQSKKRGLLPNEEAERSLLREVVMPALEDETPLRELELDADAERRLRGFQLLSAKPLLAVFNLGEKELQAGAGPPTDIGKHSSHAVAMSVLIEREIAQLPAADQQEFLQELGLEEPSLHRVLRASYDLLGRISFFTVGEDEVRAWTIRRGTVARQAGGAVHSDIARGFIRAEVVPWNQLLDRGSLAACREAGSLRLEGKEYLVADGDIVHFRFNV